MYVLETAIKTTNITNLQIIVVKHIIEHIKPYSTLIVAS